MKPLVLLLLLSLGAPALAQPHLTLAEAVAVAIASDPWLSGSRYREQALNSESIAAASLPDPKVSLMAMNFPVDSFDFNQEPMTQFTVGVSQMFSRGDSLGLSGRQKRELAAQEPLLRQDRNAKVTATVTQLWLAVFKAQESLRLIEQDRSLFEYLVDVTRAGYSSALGRTRLQDIIRAQLELTRLDDRLTVLRQQLESSQQRLSEWVGVQAHLPVLQRMPDQDYSVLPFSTKSDDQWLYERVDQHPALKAFDQRIHAMQTGVELARQKYKPEWGLSAQYGYRGDAVGGRDRPDLFSVGITFDVPLFTANRQGKTVSAAISRSAALKSDKQLIARRLMVGLESATIQLRRLNERHTLYVRQLLPQMAEQAEAALAAYNSDDGDFAEAIRARIAELNTKIDFLNIRVDRFKAVANLNYFRTSANKRNARGVAQ